MKEQIPLIQVENMKKYYPVKGGIIPHTTGYIKAVDGVSFSVMRGQTRSDSSENPAVENPRLADSWSVWKSRRAAVFIIKERISPK